MTPSPRPPRWITPLYLAALLLTIAALALVGIRAYRHALPSSRETISDLEINLGGTPVREHCMTCHPEGSAAGSSRSHPDIKPHEIAELGCTGCHLGEGMALDARISHGLPGNGARRLLKGRDLQASCYRCHPLQPLTGAEQAWAGYRLFLQKACDSCHPLVGLQGSGRTAPDLSAVGDHLGVEELVTAIRDPARDPVNSTMPRYPLSKRQARKLALFLKSRTARPLFRTPLQNLKQTSLLKPDDLFLGIESMAPGPALLVRSRCTACHRYNDQDGRIAPDLTYIGLLRPAEFLKRFPAAPDQQLARARMPAIQVSEQEAEKIAGELRQNAGQARQRLLATASEARDLYMPLCQRCHAADGNGRGPIAANLAQQPRAFAGNFAFFARRSDAELRRSLAKGIPGTSMPGFERLLDEGQRDMLLDLLFKAFIGGDRFAKETTPPVSGEPEFDLPQAEADHLFAERCARCHGRSGTGQGPEAARLDPAPRNLTNRAYIGSRSDDQLLAAMAYGVPGSAMPAWREELNDGELWGLLHRVRRFASGEGP